MYNNFIFKEKCFFEWNISLYQLVTTHEFSLLHFVGSTYLGQVGTLVGWTVKEEEEKNNQTCRPRKLGLPILGQNECIRAGIDPMNFHNDSGCVGVLGGKSIVCEVCRLITQSPLTFYLHFSLKLKSC